MGFERLRRESGAKAIQRNWRAMQIHRAEGECALLYTLIV